MCLISGPNNSPEVCIIDRGGPLFYRSNDTNYIHGIHSFGISRCTIPLIEDVTNVFTKVGSYLDWIEETVWPDDVTIARGPR